MPLYNHLKEYRAKINVNQHEMGQLVGVSRKTISQIERGDYSPSVTLALKIAKVFEVPVEAIFTYEEESEEESAGRCGKKNTQSDGGKRIGRKNSRQGGEAYDRRDREMQPED